VVGRGGRSAKREAEKRPGVLLLLLLTYLAIELVSTIFLEVMQHLLKFNTAVYHAEKREQLIRT